MWILLVAQDGSQIQLGAAALASPGVFALPKLTIEVCPAFQSELSTETWGLLQGRRDSFDQENAAAAAGVHQGCAAIPARKLHQPCSQVLLQRSGAHGGAVTPPVQAAAAAIQAQYSATAVEVEMQSQIGMVQVDRRAFSPSLPLQVHQGVLHLQSGVVAVVQPRGCASHVHPEAHRGMQPALPIQGVADAVIEIIPALTGKIRHLPQQTEGQSRLQMQSIEAGHIGLKGGGSAQGLNPMGP